MDSVFCTCVDIPHVLMPQMQTFGCVVKEKLPTQIEILNLFTVNLHRASACGLIINLKFIKLSELKTGVDLNHAQFKSSTVSSLAMSSYSWYFFLFFQWKKLPLLEIGPWTFLSLREKEDMNSKTWTCLNTIYKL